MGDESTGPVLPPGTTGISWNGVIYVRAPDGGLTDMDGKPVERPEGFPSDEELAKRFKAGPAPLPSSPGSSGSISSGGEAADDFDTMSKDDLVEQAQARGLTVTRSGGGGPPTKDDYVRALKASR
jgi:hypothetical protein